MRIYNRNSRKNIRYYLRLVRTDMTPMDYWTLAMALLLTVLLWPAAVNAQIDPCLSCQAEHGGSACPCLPVQVEPTPWPPPPPPPGGTIPPVTGIACLPDGTPPDMSGCEDKTWLPLVARGHQ